MESFVTYLQLAGRRCWRKIPSYVRQYPPVARLKQYLHKYLLGHNAIYDSRYYADLVEPTAVRSAGAMSESILRDLESKTVIDVGCGTGALLEALRERGCQVFGLEYSKVALEYCRARGLDVRRFDIEGDVLNSDRTFDVAISLEVAEHLPERFADRYVDLLTGLSSRIIFSAATSGQGGRDHVNEQPRSYWIGKFQVRGFREDRELSERWSDSWRATGMVADWYYRNLAIFKRISTD